MRPLFIPLAVLFAFSPSPLGADEAIVHEEPRWRKVEEEGKEVFFRTRDARDGRLDLTATNGFFDPCFQAYGAGEMVPGDDGLIGVSFESLGQRGKATGTARWHLVFRQPGKFKARVFMSVPEKEAGHDWTFRFGDQEQVIKAAASSADKPQPQMLEFEVKEPGHHRLVIDCSEKAAPSRTRIHLIQLAGKVLDGAGVARARWRPAAVHQRYSAPESCRTPHLWVFETRAVAEPSSYSPLTTPFGYYGLSFGRNGRIAPGASFNFSMWFASREAEKAPPISQMPRILATGLPNAKFGHFGHEGSGVKLRGAVAYPQGADRTIQALRVSYADGLWTYYGYFYDETDGRWRLFAAGRKPGKRGRKPDPAKGLLRSTGSFCEIPGPPNRQRSGDQVRLIKRRGWFVDQEGGVFKAVMKEGRKRKRRGEPTPSSKQRYYMDDYASEGWMAMATGGVRFYLKRERGELDSALDLKVKPEELPPYLQGDKFKQLFKLPVNFGDPKLTWAGPSQAEVVYPLQGLGANAKAVLHYGPVDALTYPPRKLSKRNGIGGSPALRDAFSKVRTWKEATDEKSVSDGDNRFLLTGLEPGKKYFYRLFVSHDDGKSWDFTSHEIIPPE